MPTRFDQELEDLRRADLTPSQRLARLADTVTKMSEVLSQLSQDLAREERRHDDVPVKEERRNGGGPA